MNTLTEMIWKQLEPKISEMVEKAYKQGAEDTIRRFAFVYDEVRKLAREDAYAEAGEIPIEEVDEEFSQTIFEEYEKNV